MQNPASSGRIQPLRHAGKGALVAPVRRTRSRRPGISDVRKTDRRRYDNTGKVHLAEESEIKWQMQSDAPMMIAKLVGYEDAEGTEQFSESAGSPRARGRADTGFGATRRCQPATMSWSSTPTAGGASSLVRPANADVCLTTAVARRASSSAPSSLGCSGGSPRTVGSGGA